jgi:hypothetical protein
VIEEEPQPRARDPFQATDEAHEAGEEALLALAGELELAPAPR